MSLIIAATDFSDVAQNAVKYACRLALDQEAEVLILHSYAIPVIFSDVAIPTTLVTDAQADAEEQMKELVNEMAQSFPALGVKGKVIYGDTVDMLDDYETSRKPMLIVVGNSINTGDKSGAWLDNTLLEEFKKLKYPVLAVPPQAIYKQVKKICFAFDNKHTGNDIALQQLTGIAVRLKAELHVINTQPGASDNKETIDQAAKDKLAAASPQYHMVYDVKDTDGAILDFVKNNQADWLVMIPRKHSFFEGLFHKSHTKAVTQNAHVPIIALHEHQ